MRPHRVAVAALVLVLCAGCSLLPLGPVGSPLPGVSASPTTGSGTTQRPSPVPGHSPKPSPRPTARATPTPSASATPAPNATPTVTPTSSGAPVSLASIRFKGVGFDSPDATTPTERTLTFRSDGAGTVTVTLGHPSAGSVRLCLWQGKGAHHAADCRTTSGGSLHGPAGAATATWNVAILGLDIQTQSIADIKLEFPSTAPRSISAASASRASPTRAPTASRPPSRQAPAPSASMPAGTDHGRGGRSSPRAVRPWWTTRGRAAACT